MMGEPRKDGREGGRKAEAASSPSSSAAASLLSEDATTKVGPTGPPQRGYHRSVVPPPSG